MGSEYSRFQYSNYFPSIYIFISFLVLSVLWFCLQSNDAISQMYKFKSENAISKPIYMNVEVKMTHHMLSHKTKLNKFRKIEIISSTFHIMKVCNEKLITKEKTGKANHICRLNSILLNNLWVNKEIKREFKNYLKMSATWLNEKSAFVLPFNLQPAKYSQLNKCDFAQHNRTPENFTDLFI